MTKGDIDRLGQRIATTTVISESDLALLQAYRQTFQDPVSRVFGFVLKAARKIDRQCIVTFRIKRLDTIIEKLQRFNKNQNGRMSLARMWDIAGCRCILNVSDDRLYHLLEIIKNEFGPDSKINDYIKEPKDSGYRSIHVYVKEKESQKQIEIQIRNNEHHNWATLVEIVDLLYGTQNKENGASGPLGRFLYLFSHASSLSNEEFSEMLKTERKMKVFERMSDVLTRNYLNIRLQWLKQKTQGNYYVIVANRQGSMIFSYLTFREAEASYYEKYLTNRDSNVVLTHLQSADFKQISMAYSNYMLAMHAFFDDYRVLVSTKIIECVNANDYYSLFKDFKIYNSNLKCHFKNLALEVRGINACGKDPSISRNQLRKWEKDIKDRLVMWRKETDAFLRRLASSVRGNSLKKWLVRSRVRQMARAIAAGQNSV